VLRSADSYDKIYLSCLLYIRTWNAFKCPPDTAINNFYTTFICHTINDISSSQAFPDDGLISGMKCASLPVVLGVVCLI
jgi:hypothetical protein